MLFSGDNRSKKGKTVLGAFQTGFLEVFAEPDPTYHSVACVWTLSFRVGNTRTSYSYSYFQIFEITRIYVYKILTLIFALPVALIMGFLFALASFVHIWLIKVILITNQNPYFSH